MWTSGNAGTRTENFHLPMSGSQESVDSEPTVQVDLALDRRSAMVTQADIEGPNGVLHVIDTVSPPPRLTRSTGRGLEFERPTG